MSDKEMIKTKIAGRKVMIFSKTFCPYCTKAKRVFKQYLGSILSEDDYEVMELENKPNCRNIQSILEEMTGAGSMPRVFINGQCIGGGDETAELDRSGDLKKMLT